MIHCVFGGGIDFCMCIHTYLPMSTNFCLGDRAYVLSGCIEQYT